MTYQETLDFLFSQLPMFQRVGESAFKKSLDNIVAFCEYLGNPQSKFKSIHVAGTNGKGSSSHTIASILQSAGLKTGLYTSPHLKEFTERIRINGLEIGQSEVIEFVEKHQAFISTLQPSFFEMTVAMAFDYFAEKKVDYAIIEVGLGGRLDSTNIIQPEICLITNIGLDHQAMLGETLPEIAVEKAGIIKKNIPVIVSQFQPEVAEVFQQKAKEVNTCLTFASLKYKWFNNTLFRGKRKLISDLPISLKGNHQQANLVGAVAVCLELGISFHAIQDGVEEVVEQTGLKGRWQQLSQNPPTFCDVGHNEDGIQTILAQLAQYRFEQLHIVWGMVSDKSHSNILEMLPKKANYYFCKPNVPRGLEADQLQQKASLVGLSGISCESVNEAIGIAKSQATENDFIFIGGSTFVVAEIENL
ncbi:MAG: dihydrofolate synthase/folylpolyglutamate synthase [Bacteroidia bacterium]